MFAALAKTSSNNGKPWSAEDIRQLKKEIKDNTPTRVMALHLDRTPGAVQQKANDLDLSTKPTNQRPYGTRGKK